MKLVTKNWEKTLRQLAGESKSELLVISPYVTWVATDIFSVPLANGVNCRLITRLKPMDFLQEASSIETIMDLIGAGVKVKALVGLHAKAYLFDNQKGVITSANLTRGGYRNVEWGVFFKYKELPDPFNEGQKLWSELKELVSIVKLREIHEDLKKHKPLNDEPKDISEDLRDRGEELRHCESANEVALINNRVPREIQTRIEELSNKDSRFSRGQDYPNFISELEGTDYRSISIKSYLWILGWCNTGGSYANSQELVKELAIEMFGHVPPQFLKSHNIKYNLKGYRYGSKEIPFKDEIIAAHLDRLILKKDKFDLDYEKADLSE